MDLTNPCWLFNCLNKTGIAIHFRRFYIYLAVLQLLHYDETLAKRMSMDTLLSIFISFFDKFFTWIQTDTVLIAEKKKTVLVAFVGGITFAEIAALRFMQSQPEFDAQIIIATSNFINGKNLMTSFQDPEAAKAASFAHNWE